MFGVLTRPPDSRKRDDDKDSEQMKAKATLKGTMGTKKAGIEHMFEFTFVLGKDNGQAHGDVFHCLAAKSVIQEKQDGYRDTSRTWDDFEKEAARDAVISCSKAANVVSKFTSFVAVDKDNHQPVSGPLKKQPGLDSDSWDDDAFSDTDDSAEFVGYEVVDMGVARNGWEEEHDDVCFEEPPPEAVASTGGSSQQKKDTPPVLSLTSLQKACGLSGADLCSAPARNAYKSKTSFGFPSTSFSRKKSAPKAKKTSKFAGFFFKSLFGSAAAAPPKERMKKKSDRRKEEPDCDDSEEDYHLNSPVNLASSASAPPAPSSSSQKTKGAPEVLSLISLQKASGAWDLTDQLVSLCSSSRDALIKGCPAEIAVNKAEGKLLWATALALVLLMGKFLDQKDEWEMIAEKAKKWMKKNLPAAVTSDKVLEAAATAVGVQI